MDAAVHGHCKDEALTSPDDYNLTDNGDNSNNEAAIKFSATSNNNWEDDDDDASSDHDDDNDEQHQLDTSENLPPNKRAKMTALAIDSIVTIDDVSAMDASTYLAWVNQQAESLPDVFVAPLTATTAISESQSQSSNKAGNGTKNNHSMDIDSSSLLSTLQVFLSHRMDILPPPTVRHVPPAAASSLSTALPRKNDSNNHRSLYSLYHAFFAQDLGDDTNDIDVTASSTATALGNNPGHYYHEWVTNTISNFSKLRIHLEQMSSRQKQQQQQDEEMLNRPIAVPKMKDRMAWHIFCLGKDEAYGNVGGRYEYHSFLEGEDDDDDDDDGVQKTCHGENNVKIDGQDDEKIMEGEKIKEDDNSVKIIDAGAASTATAPVGDTTDECEQHPLSSSDTMAIGDECDDTTTVIPTTTTTTTTTSTQSTSRPQSISPSQPQLTSSKDIYPPGSDNPSSQTQQPHHHNHHHHPPTLPLLLQFDQVLTRAILHHHVHYFCEYKLPLTRARASWIYAILARLEKPLHREECAAVRCVLRECCERRWNLVLPLTSIVDDNEDGEIIVVNNNEQNEDHNHEAWEQLSLLNTLIAITGVYFEQAAPGSGSDGCGINNGSMGKNVVDSLFSVS